MVTLTKERPILFSAPMVQAILEGRKIQTRRVVKPQPVIHNLLPNEFGRGQAWGYQLKDGTWQDIECDGLGKVLKECPHGRIGDRLWVREAWTSLFDSVDQADIYLFRADDDNIIQQQCGVSKDLLVWKPSIFMPRAASRILLEITEVKVERVRDISEEDAIAEGVERHGDGWKCYGNCDSHNSGHDKRTSATASFMSLWDSINGKTFPWDSNPWVWALTFKVVEVKS